MLLLCLNSKSDSFPRFDPRTVGQSVPDSVRSSEKLKNEWIFSKLNTRPVDQHHNPLKIKTCQPNLDKLDFVPVVSAEDRYISEL